MNTLDPRPARQLTSREACNVLGGFIGAMGAVYTTELRTAFELVAMAVKDRRPLDPILLFAEQGPVGKLMGTEKVIAVGLVGMCAMMHECAGPESTRTAVLWWWQHLDRLLDAAGPLAAAMEAAGQNREEQPS